MPPTQNHTPKRFKGDHNISMHDEKGLNSRGRSKNNRCEVRSETNLRRKFYMRVEYSDLFNDIQQVLFFPYG